MPDRGLRLRFGNEARIRHGRRARSARAVSAPSGLRFGASRDGDLTRPASIAASAMRHVLGGFSEVALSGGFDTVGARAEIDAVEIELEDLGLAECLRSSHSASSTSCSLRWNVRSCVRNRFFASCWVRVDPPCDTPRCRMLVDGGCAQNAPGDRRRNANRTGGLSMAMKAFGRKGGRSFSAKHWRRPFRRAPPARCRRCR